MSVVCMCVSVCMCLRGVCMRVCVYVSEVCVCVCVCLERVCLCLVTRVRASARMSPFASEIACSLSEFIIYLRSTSHCVHLHLCPLFTLIVVDVRETLRCQVDHCCYWRLASTAIQSPEPDEVHRCALWCCQGVACNVEHVQ